MAIRTGGITEIGEKPLAVEVTHIASTFVGMKRGREVECIAGDGYVSVMLSHFK